MHPTKSERSGGAGALVCYSIQGTAVQMGLFFTKGHLVKKSLDEHLTSQKTPPKKKKCKSAILRKKTP